MILLRVFVPFAIAYYFSYFFRMVNAVIAPDVARDLGITASDLGLLTSAYFVTFSTVQVPLGILLDRFGARRTESALLLFAAAGSLVFALAETLGGLIVGRALIGLGVSACLMGALKAFNTWFSKERLPLVTGCQMAMGGIGGLTATKPVSLLLEGMGWRGLFVGLAVITALVALLIFVAVPERPSRHTTRASLKEQFTGVVRVFTSPVIWRIAPVLMTIQSSFVATATLWAGPWLRDVGGLGPAGVGDYLLVFSVAMVVGFFGLAAAAERMNRVGIGTIAFTIFCCIVFMAAEVGLALEWTGAMLPIWIVFGIFGTTCILPYSVIPQSFPPDMSGRVITALNVLIFATAFAVQWGIGIIIDLWPPTAAGNYAPDGYRTAFAILLAMQAAALAWFFLRTPRPATPFRGRP